ncbi:MAG: lipoyl(octanoyl) transferase LipB [Candidatus Heimdallarchaeum endolithica]|uniref:Probable octanoyltransferase n=1 Tax=Candidatus Heimdallarchaeum endolithica TaxID=2876572 RepID=A0A9Y1FNF2_9ARCH|nr:MAG: lipoyl(octanoyl) transferase LipB [Candidatus Heimdallarchaeum endolithica]
MSECFVIEYDTIDYLSALNIQNRIRNIKEEDREHDNFLLLLQHEPPVFTLGKQGKRSEILVSDEVLEKEGIEVVEIRRGGKVTYHGPGQLVAYFLLDLIQLKITIPDFVHKMEEVVIQTIMEYNIEGFRREEYPGVWIKHNGQISKIAAVGARASKHITSHGLALNINTNMSHFQMIIPCGITDFKPISLKEVLNRSVDMREVYEKFKNNFAKVFNIEIKDLSPRDLLTKIEKKERETEKQ